MPKKTLLLMNMGGATARDELRMFLTNMFRDPNILTIRSNFFRGLLAKLIVSRRLDASWANYEGIGGSPLPRITDELVAKLTEKIGNEYLILPVMCYTKPGNDEAIEILRQQGITDITLFPLYPHYSTTTVKSSVESFLGTLFPSSHETQPPSFPGTLAGNLVPERFPTTTDETKIPDYQTREWRKFTKLGNGENYTVRIIEPFYADANYNQVIIERITEALHRIERDSCTENDKTKEAGFLSESTLHEDGGQEGPRPTPGQAPQEQILPSSEGQKPRTQYQEPSTKYHVPNTTLLFSAHGLPEKIVKRGDPYQQQVEEHVQILSQMLAEQGMNFKQIKLAYQSRVGPMKWIEPSLEETLAGLKGEKVIIYPISFTIDNSETIYELHREYAEHAKQFGVATYEVCDCPNTNEGFVESIIRKLA